VRQLLAQEAARTLGRKWLRHNETRSLGGLYECMTLCAELGISERVNSDNSYFAFISMAEPYIQIEFLVQNSSIVR
jgi:hypothetical protein